MICLFMPWLHQDTLYPTQIKSHLNGGAGETEDGERSNSPFRKRSTGTADTPGMDGETSGGDTPRNREERDKLGMPLEFEFEFEFEFCIVYLVPYHFILFIFLL